MGRKFNSTCRAKTILKLQHLNIYIRLFIERIEPKNHFVHLYAYLKILGECYIRFHCVLEQF